MSSDGKRWVYVFVLRQTISLQIFERLSSTNFTWIILEYFVPNGTGSLILRSFNYHPVSLLVFFLWLVKSVKNLKIIALKWDLCSNFTVSGLLDQLQIFRLLYVIELLGLLIGLGYSSCITWFIQGFQQGLVCWSSQTQVIWNFSSDIWLYFVFSSGRLIK